MNLREAILDALVDDPETIIQIEEYVKYLKITASLKEIKDILNDLYINNKIMIIYPENLNLTDLNKTDAFNELWFDLTEDGKLEWDKIIVD